jgi:hypothetical protein
MSGPRRTCLECGTITTDGTRCQDCRRQLNRQRERARHRPPRIRPHYAGNYQARAKAVRDNASVCWICLEGPRPNDPWTADHLTPGDPNSALAPAHRSCNSRRGNRTHDPRKPNEHAAPTPPDFSKTRRGTPRL